jgi:hypothetical protein
VGLLLVLWQGFAEFNSPEEARRAMVRDRAYIGERFVKLIRVPRHEMESQLGATGFAPPKAGGGGNLPPPQQQQQQVKLRFHQTMSGVHLQVPTNELVKTRRSVPEALGSADAQAPCWGPGSASTLPAASGQLH